MECPDCSAELHIEGDYPDFTAYCDECDDYVDAGDLAEEYLAAQGDLIFDTLRDREFE